jgi:hypothetical protein
VLNVADPAGRDIELAWVGTRMGHELGDRVEWSAGVRQKDHRTRRDLRDRCIP